MNITKTVENSNILLKVSGRLDTASESVFREELDTIDFSSLEELTLDFKELSYISSAGLRVLLTLKKKMGERCLHLINVCEAIDATFNITGFSSFLDYSLYVEEVSDYRAFSFKELIDYRCKTCKHSIAIDDGDELYSWGDIEKCSQILADDLRAIGVKRGSHVGICGANSANWIISFYALQKLGAITALLNNSYGISELSTVSRSGDIDFLCLGEATAASDYDAFVKELKNSKDCKIKHVFDIRRSYSPREKYDDYDSIKDLYREKVETDDPCIMIFTSGSTGVPKGVLLSAYNLMNACYSTTTAIHQNKNDSLCLVLPLFHIFGLQCGLISSAVTESLLVLPKNIKTSTLIDVVSKKKCTIMHSVPTLVFAIVNNREFTSEKMSSLRSTILAGAAASAPQIEMLREKFPNNHFGISYGLSEMAPVTITEYEDTVEHITTTVGKPVENIEIFIRNIVTDGKCDIGAEGEILVRGHNLMCYYYKMDLDQQSIDEDGWLHTGDLGYIDNNGYVHFVGRIKELIIRGGENVYPNEIAAVISNEEGIADVKVLGAPDDFWGETVEAAIILKQGVSFDAESFKENLKSKLAKHKIPDHFFIYEQFPLLANGKIDAVNLKKEIAEKVRLLKGV